jgi:hypothetical protein
MQAGARGIEVVAEGFKVVGVKAAFKAVAVVVAAADRAVAAAAAVRADLRPLFFGFRSPKPVSSNPSL